MIGKLRPLFSLACVKDDPSDHHRRVFPAGPAQVLPMQAQISLPVIPLDLTQLHNVTGSQKPIAGIIKEDRDPASPQQRADRNEKPPFAQKVTDSDVSGVDHLPHTKKEPNGDDIRSPLKSRAIFACLRHSLSSIFAGLGKAQILIFLQCEVLPPAPACQIFSAIPQRPLTG